jgi:hypothetical protein
MRNDRDGLLRLRDAFREELRSRKIRGVEGVAIGGRGGAHFLLVAVDDTCHRGDIPSSFEGVDVEVDQFGHVRA